MAQSFWILDGVAISGRNGLYGIATTTRPTWWANEFGRQYSGRDGAWGGAEMAGDAPVSLAYRPPGEGPWGWYVLGAHGTLAHVGPERMLRRTLETRGPLRRLRKLDGGELVAVGAHGQILLGTFERMRALDDLFDSDAKRFFVDVVGTSWNDLTVLGRGGEVFHHDEDGWHEWSCGPSDLHVGLAREKTVYVGGDGGAIHARERTRWRQIAIATEDPVVGLAWHEDRLWAATPTAIFAGTTRLAKVDDPGFGGQLAVGDGVLHCFGVASIARRIGGAWRLLEHPDQHASGAPPAWPSLGDSLEQASRPARHPAADLGGRLFGEGEIGPADVKRWTRLARSASDVTQMLGDPGMYSVLEIDGDLHVAGDLDTLERKLVGLVVHGDLVVDGLFRDTDYPRTLTVVGGALRAKTIVTRGQLEVRGAVTCEHLMGDYNDYGADFDGPVTARLFWPEYHHFELARRPRFDLVVGRDAAHRVPAARRKDVEESSNAELRAALRADLFDEREVSRKRVLAALSDGKSIWRGRRR